MSKFRDKQTSLATCRKNVLSTRNFHMRCPVHSNGAFTLTETETVKNGLYIIEWRCSYCPETDTNANFHWVLYTYYPYLYRSRYRAVWMSHNVNLPLSMNCMSRLLSPILAAWMTFGNTPISFTSAGNVPDNFTVSKLIHFHWNLSGASLKGVMGLSPRNEAPRTPFPLLVRSFSSFCTLLRRVL